MKNKKTKQINTISEETAKLTFIYVWIAIVILMGILFIAVSCFQNDSERTVSVTKLSAIEQNEAINYGNTTYPINIANYYTSSNKVIYPVYTLTKKESFSKDTMFLMTNNEVDNSIKNIIVNGNYLVDTLSTIEKRNITQIAIWIYQNELTNSEKSTVLSGKYKSYIEKLLSSADNTCSNEEYAIDIYSTSNKLTLSNDKNYYLSSPINITLDNACNIVNGYSIDKASLPKNTIITDNNGKEITNLKNIKTNLTIELKIPKIYIHSENKSFTLKVYSTKKNYYMPIYEPVASKLNTTSSIVRNNFDVELINNISDMNFYVSGNVPIKILTSDQEMIFMIMTIFVALSALTISYLNYINISRKNKKRQK